MSTTATLKARLELNNSGFLAGMNGAMANAKKFAANLPTAAVKTLQAGFFGAAAGATALAVGLAACIQKAAKMQKLEASFDVLLGGQAAAKGMLKAMNQLAARTPLKTEDIARAGKSLLAFGEDQSTVIETIRRMGDIAAGVDAPINDIAPIYGKARVQGRLFAEDINQLTGRGIPIITELAKVFGVTDGEVKQLVTDGKIGFPQLEKAFANMTNQGGKFFGMMAKQSQTWEGQLSTLGDNVDMAMAAFGRPWIDKLTPYLEKLNTSAGTLESFGRNMGAGLSADFAAAIEGQDVNQAILNVSKMFFQGMFAASKAIGTVLLASLLNAVQGPIAAIQALMASLQNKAINTAQGKVGLSAAEEKALEGHRQGLESDKRAAEKLTPEERNGEMGSMVAESILNHQKRINAAEDKRGLETDPAKIYATTMASGGPKIGFGKGSNPAEMMTGAESDFKASMAGILPQTSAAMVTPVTKDDEAPTAPSSVPVPKFDASTLQSLADNQFSNMTRGASGMLIPGTGSTGTAGDFSSINAEPMNTSGSMADTFGKGLVKSQNFSVFKPSALGSARGEGFQSGMRPLAEQPSSGLGGSKRLYEGVREKVSAARAERQAKVDARYGRGEDHNKAAAASLAVIERKLGEMIGN